MMADSLLLGEVTSPRKRDQKVVFEDVEVKLTNRDKQLSVLLVTKMVNTSFISNKDGQYIIFYLLGENQGRIHSYKLSRQNIYNTWSIIYLVMEYNI